MNRCDPLILRVLFDFFLNIDFFETLINADFICICLYNITYVSMCMECKLHTVSGG